MEKEYVLMEWKARHCQHVNSDHNPTEPSILSNWKANSKIYTQLSKNEDI